MVTDARRSGGPVGDDPLPAERDGGEVGTALEALAESYGVQPAYLGARDQLQSASKPALLHVLRSLGAPIEEDSDVPDALRARRLEVGARMLQPASVHWRDGGHPAGTTPSSGATRPSGSAPSVRLRVPAGGGDTVHCRLELERGEAREWDVTVDELTDLGGERLEGRAYRIRELPLPAGLPDGVHRLRVEAGGVDGKQWVLRAPRRAFPGTEDSAREWGVFLPLYALRTRRSWGTADLTDLGALAEWTAGLGGQAVGTLPLLAAHLGEAPFDPSPYAPLSRLFWNELYVDVESAPELDTAPEARRVLESGELREAVERLRGADRVDYEASVRWKHRALQPLADAVVGDDPHRHPGLRAWLEDRPEALTYARFRAVGSRQGRGWREWPESLRAAAGDPRRLDDAMEPAAFRLHLYAQWLADRQMGRLAEGGGTGLHLDLPLGTHPDGFDTWRHPTLFARGVSGGAPPDAFFEGGQDWGFPPLHPQALRSDGYAYWRAALRTQLRATSLLRVDHVMGLHRLFWVPRGLGAREGVYVRYPAEELWALLCLESARHRTEIVGEDLGTVPPDVREAMDRHGVRRMYVVPFEVADPEEDGDPDEWLAPVPANAVASLGTHDLPPFAAFWRERSGGATGDPDSTPARAAVRRVLEHLAASAARWLLVSLEDLWLETEPQNVPGPGAEGESWRRKARHDFEEIVEMPEVVDVLREVDRLRKVADSHETTAPGKG